MVTNEDFAKGMNNLFKKFNKLSPLKKLRLRLRCLKKSDFQGLKIKIKEDKWSINSVISSLHYSRCTNGIDDLL